MKAGTGHMSDVTLYCVKVMSQALCDAISATEAGPSTAHGMSYVWLPSPVLEHALPGLVLAYKEGRKRCGQGSLKVCKAQPKPVEVSGSSQLSGEQVAGSSHVATNVIDLTLESD